MVSKSYHYPKSTIPTAAAPKWSTGGATCFTGRAVCGAAFTAAVPGPMRPALGPGNSSELWLFHWLAGSLAHIPLGWTVKIDSGIQESFWVGKNMGKHEKIVVIPLGWFAWAERIVWLLILHCLAYPMATDYFSCDLWADPRQPIRHPTRGICGPKVYKESFNAGMSCRSQARPKRQEHQKNMKKLNELPR